MSDIKDKGPGRRRDFQLRLRELNVPDDKFLADLRRVAQEFGHGRSSARLYQTHGRYSHTALSERFGSWNNALRKAGLPLNNVTDTPDVRLFENLERVWVQLRRQPGRRDMVKP